MILDNIEFSALLIVVNKHLKQVYQMLKQD